MLRRILERFTGQRSSPETETRAAFEAWQAQQNDEKVLTLARVLSGDDTNVMTTVASAINNPTAYYLRKGKNGCIVSKPEPAINPFYVAHETLIRNGFVAGIDWKSDADELMAAVNPLLERRGVRDFDWSFIDAFDAAQDWESLKNENLLPILGAKIADRGLVLASLWTGGDNYDFAILPPGDFAKINGLSSIEIVIEKFG